MRLVVRFFNCEIGFFVNKRFEFADLFNKVKFAVVSNEDKKDVPEENKWCLDFNVEKRVQAITGYNFETNSLDESGTCLLKWLFRDVHTNILHNEKYFDAVMDVPLENTENWREILLLNGADDEQIRIFNICCGRKLRFVLEKIASKKYDLFDYIIKYYADDREFNILLYSEDDLE